MAENKQRQKLVHLHTSEVKAPTKDLIELGEIAVQHNDTEAALYIKKNNGEIAKFIDESAVDAKIKEEKDRAEGAEAALGTKISTLSGSSHTHANKVELDKIAEGDKAKWDGAEENAKKYADGLAKNYDAAGAADTVKSEVIGTDGDDKDSLTIKGAKKYADSAAAQALVDAKANAAELYQVKGNYEAAGAAATVKSEVIGTDSSNKDSDTIKGAKKYADSAAATAKATAKSEVIGTSGDTKDSDTITGAKKYADVLNTAMDGRVNALQNDSHTHANKVELDKIAEGDKAKWDDAALRLDNFLVGTGAADVVDTLQDIKNWMDGDGVVATELTAAIAGEARLREDADKAMDNRIKVLEGIDHNAYVAADATTLESAKSYADGLAKNYDAAGAAATVKSDVIGTDGDDKDSLTIKGAKKYADSTAATVKSEIIGADSNDKDSDTIKGAKKYADSAATKALADAKSYADGLDTAMDTRVDALETSSHTHANKAELDKIVDGDKAKWDAAEGNAKKYTDDKIAVLRIDCGTY